MQLIKYRVANSFLIINLAVNGLSGLLQQQIFYLIDQLLGMLQNVFSWSKPQISPYFCHSI